MKIGERVKVINPITIHYNRIGIVTGIDEEFGISVSFNKREGYLFPQKYLKLVEEPKVYHLDLSLEDMNALAELGKMKDNLELLERLLKRAKGETND